MRCLWLAILCLLLTGCAELGYPKVIEKKADAAATWLQSRTYLGYCWGKQYDKSYYRIKEALHSANQAVYYSKITSPADAKVYLIDLVSLTSPGNATYPVYFINIIFDMHGPMYDRSKDWKTKDRDLEIETAEFFMYLSAIEKRL